MEEEALRKKTMSHSMKDAAAASVMSGAGEAYITPFAVELKASNAQIGFLSSFVGLFGALSQIYGSILMYDHSRRKIIRTSVLAQCAIWFLISAIGFLYWKSLISHPVYFLIFLYTFAVVASSLSGPAWFSLLGDIVPEKYRGGFFSKRNKLANFVSLVSTFVASYFLDITKEVGFVLVGFSIIFLIATIARLISAYHLCKHHDPKTTITRESYFTFFQFIKKAPNNNFGKFVIYIALINFALAFSAPFFTVYMLSELHYSYMWFTLVNISSAVFTILTLGLWGRIGDKYGNKMLLTIGAIIVPISPILWIVSKDPIVLILTAQLASGIGWGAFNFGTSNFIYDAVTPQRRAICVAYYTMLIGIGTFIGGIIGGLFAEHVHITFMNLFILMFIISGVMRAIISIIMIPQIKEVRKVKTASTKKIIREEMRHLHQKMFFKSFRGTTEVHHRVKGKKIKE